jgi:outer membrane protein assembly factor BamD
MKFRLYIALIVLLLASSCGEYQKLLKSSDFELKKQKVKEYYDATEYVKATELLAQILPRYRATEEAEELNWINVYSFYGMKDYYVAGTYFKTFINEFPFGKHAEEANFLAALCDYNIAPRPDLDQENTRNAIEGFKVFITRFPSSSKVDEAKKLIKVCEEKLVEKSYLSARLYYDMQQYKAAVLALNNSLKEYSDTKYREEMMYLKLTSLYLYADNSRVIRQKERFQATLDDYYSYMEEFPKSQYSKEVNSIFVKTNKYLKTGVTETEVKK